MPTLYERINATIFPFETVTDAQRSQIGYKVAARFKEAYPNCKMQLSKRTFTNEKGIFKVTVYPDYFSPEMDAIIAQELAPKPPKSIPKVAEIKAEPPPKKQRKRIPIPVKSQKVQYSNNLS